VCLLLVLADMKDHSSVTSGRSTH